MDQPLHHPAPLRPPRRKGRPFRRDAAARQRVRWIAGATSVGLHLLAAVLLLLLMRRGPPIPADHPPGTVELLMVEKKGSGDPVPASPPETRPAAIPTVQTPPPAAVPPPLPAPHMAAQPPPGPAAKQAVAEKADLASPGASAQSPPDQAEEPLPPRRAAARQDAKTDPLAEAKAPPNPDAKAAPQPDAKTAPQQEANAAPQRNATPAEHATPEPPQPRKSDPLVLNLDGTDSESNAIVLGGRVIPASRDDRFRNRPPIYPYDAVLRGQHGAVLLIIHVSGDGAAAGVDIAESSGVASLDRAAVDAVLKWHFRPAMQDGEGIPFDMPMRFIFQSE